MGCDIHGVFQKRTANGWVDIPTKWDQRRHYFLFSWLADVRNGFGFAGVPTYAPITPIAMPRGLPDDFESEQEMHPTTLEVLGEDAKYLEDKAKPEKWMGDHSHSWLTADEILATPIPVKTWKTGVIERAAFDAWDGYSQPEEYSGVVSGSGVRVAESPVEVEPDSTHVRVYWIQPSDAVNYFIDEVRRLKEEHGEVRVVFGFDS